MPGRYNQAHPRATGFRSPDGKRSSTRPNVAPGPVRFPQLTRLIEYAKTEASEYDEQTLVDFLEDYEPDDLLDRIQQPWWNDRAPAPRSSD